MRFGAFALLILAVVALVNVAAAAENVTSPGVVHALGLKFDKSFNELAWRGAGRFKAEIASPITRPRWQRQSARPGIDPAWRRSSSRSTYLRSSTAAARSAVGRRMPAS